MKNLSIFLSLGTVVVFLALTWIFSSISVKNREVELRNSFTAQTQVIEGVYDTMWKTITESYTIADNERESFKETLSEIYKSAGDKGSTPSMLFTALGIKAPEPDSSLYKNVQNLLIAKREEFQNAQVRVLSLKVEHDNLRQKFPGSMFVGDVDPLEYEMISSTQAKEVMETRKDDRTLIPEK